LVNQSEILEIDSIINVYYGYPIKGYETVRARR